VGQYAIGNLFRHHDRPDIRIAVTNVVVSLSVV
jgi:hypothetical protein